MGIAAKPWTSMDDVLAKSNIRDIRHAEALEQARKDLASWSKRVDRARSLITETKAEIERCFNSGRAAESPSEKVKAANMLSNAMVELERVLGVYGTARENQGYIRSLVSLLENRRLTT